MKIRKATHKNLDAILDLNLKLFKFEREFTKSYNLNWTYSKTGKDYFKSRLTRENGIVFVAEEEGEIIGYICGYVGEFAYRDPQNLAEIDNMYVKSSHRRKGIGKKLMEAFEKEARKKGAKRIKVEAIHANRIGKNFYQKQKYHQHGITFEKKL